LGKESCFQTEGRDTVSVWFQEVLVDLNTWFY